MLTHRLEYEVKISVTCDYMYLIFDGILKSIHPRSNPAYFFRSRLSRRAARFGQQAVVRAFCLHESATIALGVVTTKFVGFGRALQAAFNFHVRANRALRPDLGNDSSDMWSRHAGTTRVIILPIFGSPNAHLGNCTPDFKTRCAHIQIVITVRPTRVLIKYVVESSPVSEVESSSKNKRRH
jgi:hypothetical protein